MSILPSLRISFEKVMNDAQRRDLMQKIAKITGVMGVSFNQLGTAVRVTYTGNPDVPAQIRAIDANLKVDTKHVL